MNNASIFLVVVALFAALPDARGANVTAPTTERIMTMTTAARVVEFSLAGAGTATIDWGDGSEPETFNISGEQIWILRDFRDRNPRTITISGAIITLLDCSENALTALDVSRNNVLHTLSCRDNRLTELKLNQNPALVWVDCSSNQLTAETLNDLFTSLHNYNFGNMIIINDNPGAADCLPDIAEAKGWIVDGFADMAAFLDNNEIINLGGIITMTTSAHEIEFSMAGSGNATIYWGDGTKRDVTITMDGATFRRRYAHSQPRTVTITGNNILLLESEHNELTALDVSQNPALLVLICEYNNLKKLNVRKNTELRGLHVTNNQLRRLNVRNNTDLSKINICDNQINKRAMRAVYRTLHNREMITKDIFVTNNPGADVKRQKAYSKGWYVDGHLGASGNAGEILSKTGKVLVYIGASAFVVWGLYLLVMDFLELD